MADPAKIVSRYQPTLNALCVYLKNFLKYFSVVLCALFFLKKKSDKSNVKL